MSYILDLAIAVPSNSVTNEELVKFYSHALETVDQNSITKKLTLLNSKTKITNRYSCISDFNGMHNELFTDENYRQPVEKRTVVYKNKILPLAAKAIDKLFLKTAVKPAEITHLITVSCTGVFAPGLEFLVAEHYGLQHTEKLALNFLGCYAAIKALKHAHYISQADPEACVLIVCAELCSLHFYPSAKDEDIISNLIFADGAAAAFVCGNESKHISNKVVFNIDSIGSAYIPNTLDLMTWDITSSAYRMYLSKNIVNAIKDNIAPVVSKFLAEELCDTDYWAIHPGGVKIVEAVKESLGLSENQIEDSMRVLQAFGNMSSPTILFILNRIINKIKFLPNVESRKIFACAFGPGLSIEMISLSSVFVSSINKEIFIKENHAVEI